MTGLDRMLKTNTAAQETLVRRRLVVETQEPSLVMSAAQGTVTAAVVGRNGEKGTHAIDIKERFLRLR